MPLNPNLIPRFFGLSLAFVLSLYLLGCAGENGFQAGHGIKSFKDDRGRSVSINLHPPQDHRAGEADFSHVPEPQTSDVKKQENSPAKKETPTNSQPEVALSQRIKQAKLKLTKSTDSEWPAFAEMTISIFPGNSKNLQTLNFNIPIKKGIKGQYQGLAYGKVNKINYTLAATCTESFCKSIEFLLREEDKTSGTLILDQVQLLHQTDIQYFVDSEKAESQPPRVLNPVRPLPSEPSVFPGPTPDFNEEEALANIKNSDLEPLPPKERLKDRTPEEILDLAAEERWPVERSTVFVKGGSAFTRIVVRDPSDVIKYEKVPAPVLVLEEEIPSPSTIDKDKENEPSLSRPPGPGHSTDNKDSDPNLPSAKDKIKPLYSAYGAKYSLVNLPDILSIGEVNELSMGERVAAVARALVQSGHQVPEHACNYFIFDVLLLSGFYVPSVYKANDFENMFKGTIAPNVYWETNQFSKNQSTALSGFLNYLDMDEAVIMQKERTSPVGHVSILVREGPGLIAVYDASLHNHGPQRKEVNVKDLTASLLSGSTFKTLRLFRAKEKN